MKKSDKKREFLMKRNLKIFLLIAVCLITGYCLLYIREENEKQQIHSEKQEKETLVFLTSKRETRHIFEKIIDDFNEILYLICDYPHKHYTFKHFEV